MNECLTTPQHGSRETSQVKFLVQDRHSGKMLNYIISYNIWFIYRGSINMSCVIQYRGLLS